MSHYIITGDRREHGEPAPVLVSEVNGRFMFVHPALVAKFGGALEYAVKDEALQTISRLRGPSELVELADGGVKSFQSFPGRG